MAEEIASSKKGGFATSPHAFLMVSDVIKEQLLSTSVATCLDFLLPLRSTVSHRPDTRM